MFSDEYLKSLSCAQLRVFNLGAAFYRTRQEPSKYRGTLPQALYVIWRQGYEHEHWINTNYVELTTVVRK